MSGFTCSVTNHCLMYIHVYIHVHVQITEFVLEILHLMDFRGTNAHPHTLFNKTVMCEKLMVGPDKPVIPKQWLFQACQLSPAGNTQNLSGTSPPLYTRTKAAPTKHSRYKSMKA